MKYLYVLLKKYIFTACVLLIAVSLLAPGAAADDGADILARSAESIAAGKPFAVFVVCRRYWLDNLNAVRELAAQQGGRYVDEVHFSYPGDTLRSMLSLTSYLGSGEYRRKYLGVPIPPTNVQPEQLEQTRAFAGQLADRLFAK